MAYEFNPLAKKGFDRYTSDSELPPALGALAVDDTATVDLTLIGDTLTGDVKNGSITYTKIQNISAENKILGRITAGAGSAEELTAANVRTIINVEDGANAYVHPDHSGDVTSVADGAQTIANEAVTLAKMANMATASFIGRNTAGAGVPEVISVATAKTMLSLGSAAYTASTDYATAAQGELADSALQAESDPDFAAWLLATPPLYPGGWYDAVQNTINLSGFNNDSGFITSFTDEKVKYDAGDATAGYVADKIIAGTGIGVAEGTGANENKLVVSSTITQYTDALAVAAVGTPWIGMGYLTDITGESIGDLSDVTLTATKTLTITESTTLSGGTHSGSNTGDQVVPANEAGAANNFLTAYNSTTGAWTKARPTWANIDKTTSDIADITTKSHTSLSDIGTNTHAQIDTFIGTTVPGTYAPLVSPSLTTPTLGAAQATSIDVGNGSTIFGSADDLTMTVTQHASAPALNLYPAGGSLTSSRFAFRCVEAVNGFARFQGCTGTNASLASSNTMGIIEFLVTQADPDPLKGVINFWTNNGDSIVLKATLNETGVFNAVGGFSDNGSAGIDTTFLDADGNTITVKGGIITSKVAP